MFFMSLEKREKQIKALSEKEGDKIIMQATWRMPAVWLLQDWQEGWAC